MWGGLPLLVLPVWFAILYAAARREADEEARKHQQRNRERDPLYIEAMAEVEAMLTPREPR